MGEMLPFADPMWMQDWYNPYYNKTHFAVAKHLREKIEEHLMPQADEWDEGKWLPAEVYKNWGEMGLLAFEQAPEVYKYLPANFPRVPGVKDNEIDKFHKVGGIVVRPLPHVWISHQFPTHSSSLVTNMPVSAPTASPKASLSASTSPRLPSCTLARKK